MRFLALALALLTFAGCSYKYPLTSGPSKDINTWLLGIWEHKDEKGNVYRASVQPLTGDRMTVWFRALGKTPKQTKQWKGEAWISRVGHANFLTIKCLESADDFPVDAFTFLHYQVLDQNHVATRPLQLDGMYEATSFQLRKEVRKKWKEKDPPPYGRRAVDTHRRGLLGQERPGRATIHPPAVRPAGSPHCRSLRGRSPRSRVPRSRRPTSGSWTGRTPTDGGPKARLIRVNTLIIS